MPYQNLTTEFHETTWKHKHGSAFLFLVEFSFIRTDNSLHSGYFQWCHRYSLFDNAFTLNTFMIEGPQPS